MAEIVFHLFDGHTQTPFPRRSGFGDGEFGQGVLLLPEDGLSLDQAGSLLADLLGQLGSFLGDAGLVGYGRLG